MPGRTRSSWNGAPRKMPEELARLARAFGKSARTSPKRRRWASFMGCVGSSAQARWLITSSGASPPRSVARCSAAAMGRPRRLMPVSTWTAHGSGRPAARAAAVQAEEVLGGSRARAPNRARGNRRREFRKVRRAHRSAPRAGSAPRNSMPSPAWATKNVVGAFGAEAPRHRHDPEAVGVRLDDGGDLRTGARPFAAHESSPRQGRDRPSVWRSKRLRKPCGARSRSRRDLPRRGQGECGTLAG